MMRVQAERGWPLGSLDWIGNLHLEPSLPCTLRCPACLQGFDPNLLRREGPPYYVSMDVVDSIMRSVKRHDVTVRRIGFGGRGEPTLNPRLPEIARRCREACPAAIIETDTNAQHPFHDDFLLLDAIFCSIDGSTQESYETYRIGGRFEKCLKFMKAAVERKRALNSNCQIVWKYILFNTTESIELLDLAQHTAAELGIDTLWFVITWTAGTNGKVFPPRKMTTQEAVQAYLESHPIFPDTRVKYQ
jgi:wyosine [tRNA(Phe)-imidazoG37] synthetase (radical SAM superfamily)